jgi:hypothetical protein
MAINQAAKGFHLALYGLRNEVVVAIRRWIYG